MTNNRKWINVVILAGITSTCMAHAGCRASIDPDTVKPRAEAPLPAVVDVVKIPKDASKPYTFLVVQPVRVSERGSRDERIINVKGRAQELSGEGEVRIESGRFYNYLLSRQREISYQLVSALSGVGNFRLIDHTVFSENPRKSGELSGGKGPYYVRAVITESTTSVVSEKRRLSLPLVYRNHDNLVESLVGLDVSLVDVESGEIVHGFPVQGTYISKKVVAGGGIAGRVTSSEVQMRSTIEQALRVALNEAAKTLHAMLYDHT
jgi:curli biogenesis system outer membrane secretion channel CsgG